MKKLLVLLALCMVISVVLVACDTPEQPVEDTTAGTTEAPTTGTEAPSETEAPTTDTEAPTTDTEAPTTDTEAPTTDTESETEPPVVIDPVKVGMSFDQLYTGNGPATAGEENFFAPGSSSSWDGNAVIEDYNVQYVTVWGWVAFFAEIPGTFGYQIGDADPVFDAAFFVEAEQGVVDAALAQGGKSAARMHISIPVEYLAGEEIVIKAVAKDAVGTVETLVEFKLTKPVNPNAPVAFIPAAEMASSIPGSVDITGAEMSADGQYVTITTGNTNGDAYHDPNYQLPMLNGKATVAQFVAIKYRTSVEGARSEVFVGSGQGPNGQGDNYAFDVVTDGKWNLAIIDLANTPAVVDNVINYLRWDPYVGTAETSTIDMAYIALFSSAEAAVAYDANFKGVLVDTLNVPTSDWTITGHRQGVQDNTDPMVSAGGVEFGALLHQGYISLGNVNLAEMSKVVIYFGIDGSQTTIDLHAASANNRIMLTSADQAMTNSPTEDVVLAANTYTELGWAVHAIEIDLTGVDYNGPVYVTYDTLPGTFMLISSVEFTYDPDYVEPEEPAEPVIGSADFNTIVTEKEFGDSSYGNSYTTEAGWTTVNSAIQSGGTQNVNPQFTVIGDNAGIRAVCLNGKVSAPGKLTSPTLTGGLSKITLTYTKMFTDTKLSVTITVTDLATGEKVEKVVEREVAKDEDKYVVWIEEWVLDTPITGDYTIEVTNNCPSAATGNKDRITILSLTYESAV